MIKTLLKAGLLAAGVYAIYRVSTGRKLLPGLAGYQTREVAIDNAHPRSCCGQTNVVRYEVWETDKTQFDTHQSPTITHIRDAYTANYEFRPI